MREARAVRVGSVDDLDAVMGLLDAAVAWLVEHGRTGQWGEQPWSASSDRVARIRRMIGGSELRLIERDAAAVAALAHRTIAHDYVPPSPEPEDYVLLLVAHPSAPGAGRRLLDEAWSRARADGVARQRVDCYAGGDGKLVRFYESAGFTRTGTFEVGGWPGQLLERKAS